MRKTNAISPCRWQLGILLMIGLFLLGMAVTMTLSLTHGSGVTDTDYYQNGLNYDRTRSGARNPGLNWTLSATLSGKDLQVRVHDEKGTLLTGGRLEFRTGGDAASATLHLSESSPGVFVAPWPAGAQSELHGVLLYQKGEACAARKVMFFN